MRVQVEAKTNLPHSIEINYYKNKKCTPPAVRSNNSSKLIFASCVWYSDRAYYWVCVFINDIGRRLFLELQYSSPQDQHGDSNQSVRGSYKTRFWGVQNLTVVKGKASVYQVYPVSRTAGEGRAEIFQGVGAGGGGGATQSVHQLWTLHTTNLQICRLWEERIRLSCILG